MRGWIGVDADGTLFHYDKWRGASHVGAPIASMVERIKGWLEQGIEVRIFTARVSAPHPEDGIARHAIKQALLLAGLPQLTVTNVKDFAMLELWDDRAIQVKANEGVPVEGSTSRVEALP